MDARKSSRPINLAFRFLSGAALLLAGCAAPAPFVADPNARPPGPPIEQQAVTDYQNCVYGYAVSRVHYDVTVDELADAAIGACQTELELVRLRYAQQVSLSAGDRAAATARTHARTHVVTLIVEARQTAQPTPGPQKSTTGT